VLVVARRAAGGSFFLPLGAGRHLLGSEPGGADLAPGADGVEVPASHGPRFDVWELDRP
jgi:alpha-glucosidase